jgi:hypothetical protein
LTGGPKLSVARVDLASRRTDQKIAAPSGSTDLAAFRGFGTWLAVSGQAAPLSYRAPSDTRWKPLFTSGTKPAFSMTGNAVYAFQQVQRSRMVSVIAMPFRLQVRLFPVSIGAVHMTTLPDGTLAIFERSLHTADVRFIACSSPLLAVEPRYKHGKFFGGGIPWQLLGLATPEPADTDPPAPASTGEDVGC